MHVLIVRYSMELASHGDHLSVREEKRKKKEQKLLKRSVKVYVRRKLKKALPGLAQQ